MKPVSGRDVRSDYGCIIALGATLALLIFVVLLVLGLSLITGHNSANTSNDASGLLTDFVCLGGGLVGSLAIVAGGVRSERALARVSRPEVSVSNLNPRVDEVVTVSYRQTFRAATDVRRIQLQLVLREVATHSAGKSTLTDTQDFIIQEYPLPARAYAAGESVQEERQFQVQAMHTFQHTWNKVNWVIRISVDMGRPPVYTAEYPLTVAPELAQ